MRDVAAAAGVSIKTVSRVVNNEPGVTGDLVRRVQEAVADLGYRHHLGASDLRRGQRRTSIGVLIQDVANGFCGELLRGVELAARSHGVAVVSASIEGPERERALIDELVSRRCDGLILMPVAEDQTYLEPEIAAGLGVVLVDRDPGSIDLDSVMVDNVAGAAGAVRHLVTHGHRRVACLLDDARISTARDRRLGYRQEMARLGEVDLAGLEIPDVRSATEAQAAVTALLQQPSPPTALFCARNEIAIGATRALQRAGRQHDVALAGFDDFPTADLLDPGVTTVRQDPSEEGRVAFDLLMSRLADPDAPPRALILETHLVARGSGEIAGPW